MSCVFDVSIKQMPLWVYVVTFSFVITMIITSLMVYGVRNRSDKKYKDKIYDKIISLKEGKKIDIFYANLHLNIVKQQRKMWITILSQNVKVGRNNKISKENNEKLKELFDEAKPKDYKLNQQGYNEMIEWLDGYSNRRKKTLKECFEQVRSDYFEQHKNYYMPGDNTIKNDYEEMFYISESKRYLGCKGNKCEDEIRIIEGETVYLEQRDSNPYNKNIIRVLNKQKKILGYVPNDYSQALASLIKEGMVESCYISTGVKGNGCDECIGVRVRIKRVPI